MSTAKKAAAFRVECETLCVSCALALAIKSDMRHLFFASNKCIQVNANDTCLCGRRFDEEAQIKGIRDILQIIAGEKEEKKSCSNCNSLPCIRGSIHGATCIDNDLRFWTGRKS